MEKKSKTDRNKAKFFSLIQVYKKSGLAQKVFCKEHHIAYSTFQYYLAKYRKNESVSGSFVEIIPVGKNNATTVIEIIFPTGAKIICGPQSDISLIRSLIL